MMYRWILAVWLCLGSAVLAGCGSQKDKASGVDWSISLSRDKTTPYGSAIAYESLPSYFPQARIEPLSRWFHYTSMDGRMGGTDDSVSLLVLLGLDFHLSEDEWASLQRFAAQGNEVFILSSNLDSRLADALSLSKEGGGNERQPLSRFHSGRDALQSLHLASEPDRFFGYVGRTITARFELNSDKPAGKRKVLADDTSETVADGAVYAIDPHPEVLGWARTGPDFLRYRIGRGHLTLHAAPLVLSNYFLLQDSNRRYLDGIWHGFPANVSTVYWNEYYERTGGKTKLSVLLQYPAMRWAIVIALIALLAYVLTGIKRRQRVVPVIPPAENTSVVFAETVGRLYFNKGDHANLARKMVQHFLDMVRSNYQLDTTQLNEHFCERLSARSSVSLQEVKTLVGHIHALRLGEPVSAEYLYTLYQEIEKFYRAR
jgi:hypothetical protein